MQLIVGKSTNQKWQFDKENNDIKYRTLWMVISVWAFCQSFCIGEEEKGEFTFGEEYLSVRTIILNSVQYDTAQFFRNNIIYNYMLYRISWDRVSKWHVKNIVRT